MTGEPTTRLRRVLVINPNTNPLVTERVRQVANRFESSVLSFEVVNPDEGPFSIESDLDKSQAESHVLALMRQKASMRHDAYVLACFDDLALESARKMVTVPVIGTCEAGIVAARAVSPRIAIVTTVATALPGIRSMMLRYGAGSFATVRAAGVGVAEAALAKPDAHERLMKAIHDAVQTDKAGVILLASGGLAGQSERIALEAGVPVIDSVEAALRSAAQIKSSPHRNEDSPSQHEGFA
jgi:allantoin racemase